MKVHVRDGDIHLLDLRTRMPFKYGIATMTRTPHLFLRLRVEIDGKLATGISADHLPPKWFTKDPNRPIENETHEMLRVVENALRLALGVRAKSPFHAWRQVHQAQSAWGREQGLPTLLTQFGTSLVERALIEATCKRAARTFQELMKDNAFGVRPGELHACLAHFNWDHLHLRAGDVSELVVRHTVGLADQLTEADIPADERLDDGLPQSLEAAIRAYRLRGFKVKVSGRAEPDLDRLRRISAVVMQNAGDRFFVTLDGNEQFHSLDEFRAYCAAVQRARDLAPFLRRVEWVEQPLHRSVALDPEQVAPHRWPNWRVVIIDESDAEPDSLFRALNLGYWGTSHKNCKGVFKSFINRAVIQTWRCHSEGVYILSGEDLANIGPVALLQDLVVASALAADGGVERNGHHYFAGLSMFPEDIQDAVLRHHGDLYHRSRDGWPTLTIRDGAVEVGSLLAAPFGVGFEVPVERFLTPDQWRRANPLPGGR